MDQYSLLITCEHAGNEIPPGYIDLFEKEPDILKTHRGWDPGAWPLAAFLGKYFKAKTIPFFYTRLLIEPNRSIEHSELFSEFSHGLTSQQKENLVGQYYTPYRDGVETTIRERKHPVLHLSIHSFTPVFKGEVRHVDVGLLFDPQRSNEAVFCAAWKKQLRKSFPDWKIAFNEPYRGIDDGFTTYLRTKFPNQEYLGIELEWNQKWATGSDAQKYYNGIAESLASFVLSTL